MEGMGYPTFRPDPAAGTPPLVLGRSPFLFVLDPREMTTWQIKSS